jgi:hypothetical protein
VSGHLFRPGSDTPPPAPIKFSMVLFKFSDSTKQRFHENGHSISQAGKPFEVL